MKQVQPITVNQSKRQILKCLIFQPYQPTPTYKEGGGGHLYFDTYIVLRELIDKNLKESDLQISTLFKLGVRWDMNHTYVSYL